MDNDWEEIRMEDWRQGCLEKSYMDGLIGKDTKYEDLFVS